jgi:hypothetical protein
VLILFERKEINMRNKKILLAVTFLIITLLPVYAQYDNEDDFEIRISEDRKSMWVLKYLGNKQNVSIPSKIYGLPVSRILDGAFADCIDIKTVIIPDSVTRIGEEAFSNCISLTGVDIPVNVSYIGSYAFKNCVSLTNVDIPERIKSIASGVFYGCVSLTGVYIPKNVYNIGAEAFYKCLKLSNLIIAEGVAMIGDDAFSGCVSLTTIYLPKSVFSFGNRAIVGCTGLTAINVDPENKYELSVDGVLYNKDKTRFYKYPAGRTAVSFVIPDGIYNIGDLAFEDCGSLTDIIIPDSLESIGWRSFSKCANLTNITIPKRVFSIWKNAFNYCPNLTSVKFEGNILQRYFQKDAFFGDLRNKFYAEDRINGKPGTYTTTAPVNENSIWTRQP